MGLKDSSLFFTDRETHESYSLSNQFAEHLEFILVKNKLTVTPEDVYYSLSLSIRDRLVRNWLRTQHTYVNKDVKIVYYLSLEFLIGRLLGNALINIDYYDDCRKILREDEYVLEDIIELENDMGLGNGGLGRLAACYLDSMATLGLPAAGYGIRYEFGIFKQAVQNGYQYEQPDNWLSYGNPWEIFRREIKYPVKFFGKVSSYFDEHANQRYQWENAEEVHAVAYDVPVPGYKNNTVNNLRLWQAKASKEFSFKDFNQGNYIAAVDSKNQSENISKVLYPNDSYEKGKYLRLKQQYFFVSASLQDIIRKYKIKHTDFREFPDKVAIQLNDTHPVIAIPELMRILVDIEGYDWETAWDITTRTFAYTNHTIVPEALEEWEVAIIEELLPRHLQIIYEINQRYLDGVRAHFTKDDSIIDKLSIIREHPVKKVKMANLAIIGSHTINGVAELHSQILKDHIFKHFYDIDPKKFTNVTNGITPRRWLKYANPLLSQIITDRIGHSWVTDLSQLKNLEKYIDDETLHEDWQQAKWLSKRLLTDLIADEYGIEISPDSLFDVQVKRFHEYKRQLLNVLHVITHYCRLKANPDLDVHPRTIIFAGKAAPAYAMAKLVIKLIHSVADVINNDPDTKDKLKMVFIRNYSVTLAEKIIPAADLSEQISTAGFEASGTGNMKFALNGALTIGTMDGANIEIREEVGDDNIFIFGLRANEILELREKGYNPKDYYEKNKELKRVIDMIANDHFNPNEPGIFKPIIDSLLGDDFYLLCADYEDYIKAQEDVDALYKNEKEWVKKSILNVARIGKFSSDRSIQDYAEKIWNIEPVKISMRTGRSVKKKKKK